MADQRPRLSDIEARTETNCRSEDLAMAYPTAWEHAALTAAVKAVLALAERYADEFDEAADRGEVQPVHAALLGAAQAIEDAVTEHIDTEEPT